MAKYLIHI